MPLSVHLSKNNIYNLVYTVLQFHIKRCSVAEKLFERKICIAAQAKFGQRFNSQKDNPKNVVKYRSHGATLNRNKENSGGQTTARFEEVIELFGNISENNPI